MHNAHDPQVLPLRDGVAPSCVVLPTQGSGTVLDFLCERLASVDRAEWLRRIEAKEVVDEFSVPATPTRPFAPGVRFYYYRSPVQEPVIPFTERIVFQDEHLLVADKPHFLPVVPGGPYVQETLLVRVRKATGLRDLSPIHRIDRDTAGLVLFSVQRATRGAYQALFRDRTVEKEYEAIAPWNPAVSFPREHHSRLELCGEFFRMHEVSGEPNSHTRMEMMEHQGPWARYRLLPSTGKRHQLRVQMAALGLPLRWDPFYPVVNDPPEGDYSCPLQLLARRIAFTDPVTEEAREFESSMMLASLEESTVD